MVEQVERFGVLQLMMILVFFCFFLNQVPPAAPVVQVVQTNQDQIQVRWKMTDDGGSSLQGFLLHWRQDGGDWEERQLDRHVTSTQLNVSYHLHSNESLIRGVGWRWGVEENSTSRHSLRDSCLNLLSKLFSIVTVTVELIKLLKIVFLQI